MTMRRIAPLCALVLAVLALVQPSRASAWGEFAHRTTAAIAWANISPSDRAEIARLLRAGPLLGTPDCALHSIEDASVWPDCIRNARWRWGYTASWHYRTAPICSAFDPLANCAGGNCVTAQIERNHRLLADESLPDPVRLEALAFLVHFIGDVHMPLHSGDRDDRGGNDRVMQYGEIPGYNLHCIWDGPLAERAITSAQPTLVRRHSSEERSALGGGDAHQWGRESWELARSLVYPRAFAIQDPCKGELPREGQLSQAAIEAAVPVARRRIEQAGIRIAQAIAKAFAPGPLVPESRAEGERP